MALTADQLATTIFEFILYLIHLCKPHCITYCMIMYKYLTLTYSLSYEGVCVGGGDFLAILRVIC